jgi:predicted Zn finger-like uncharacterized protein
MIADCPSCARRWVLPPDRIGRGGAVVRCASCETEFSWSPPRFESAHAYSYESAPVSAVAELDDADATAPMVTRLAVEELALEGGAAMLAAWDEGCLFDRYGYLIARAWEHCRARLGPGADPAAFREALRARLGIDLPEWSA